MMQSLLSPHSSARAFLLAADAHPGRFGLPDGVDFSHTVALLAIIGAITVGLRAVPYVAAGAWKDSALLARASVVLPVGLMSVLAFRSSLSMGSPVAAVLALALTIAVQWWRRSMMLSLVVGTGAYMALVAFGVA
ncbi:AzlD domain-containing protein [Corynebacterium sp. 13CS0277]|uniref:AzlD domain-containing protein n=1 Tax=Corynebacterium sp. 13CS0277 TaxID=2071994 RepID=UPI001304B110|nr:AzlD domain-containing protein [Corynebacterium sp. 13CS0277]